LSSHSDATDLSAHSGARPRWQWWAIGVGAVAFGFFLGWALLQLVQQRPFGPPNFHGTVIQSDTPTHNFTLTDQTGARVSLTDFRGKVVLLYFGYTYCPDVCPATLRDLARVKQALGSAGGDLQVVMVSLDPARDTPAHLAEYLAYFDPSFVGLTGSENEIAAAATPLGIFYEKHAGTVATGYLIDHTASVLALDRGGRVRLVYPFNTPPAAIAADMRYLLRD